MKNVWFITVLAAALMIVSCRKDPDTELEENPTCENFDRTINDSLVALMTRKTSTRVEIVKVQNGTLSVVASEAGYEFWGPAVSPDRQHFICFRSPTTNSISVNDYMLAELWMFDIDGSNGHPILTRMANAWRSMGMASWAYDGVHFVIAGEKMESDGNFHWNIYLTDTTATPAIRMNTRLGNFVYPRLANGNLTNITYAAWPVGTTLGGDDNDLEIFQAGVDGSGHLVSEYRITNNNLPDASPSFSPDNMQIAWSQNTSDLPDKAVEIWKANYGMNTQTRILSNNNINQNAIWCPGVNRVYFINKTSKYCYLRVGRVDENGSSFELPYQIFNAQIYHIDIR